ncbi:hypothetical protein HYPSUDRAFT_209641 [Hypholoma sublateritium FD-334 SS-4]|uniref:Fungal-type protein kinase domain-containing protein n=1 Tax=Hypholoma sublateritium (strain FD-334 SS-4) TaxID=945553 RepID=A0A0D2LR69_HYPSF|nr:hypothetical protein HYPSUDRAFT_209641 [Hypholoma sublateritium FD-334 SS-4]
MSTTGSSPIKKGSAAYAPHIRSEIEKVIEPKIEVVDVDDFWKSLGYCKNEFPYADRHVRDAGIHTMDPMNLKDKVFSGCFNKLSAHVHTLLRLGPEKEIQFFDTPNLIPKDHPTGTICRPDIIATTQRGEIHWTGIEATVEPSNHPEFLHEAFQRLILNFLVDNKDEAFMLLPTAGKPRECEKQAHYAAPVRSRHQHLMNTSSAGGSSLKRPASSQDELERKAKKATGSVTSSSVGVTTRSQMPPAISTAGKYVSTRAVHRNCNVLQRHASTGNIVATDRVVPSPSADSAYEHIFDEQTEYADEAGDPPAIFRGARYLLGETNDRQFTKNLLVDFENEKQDELRLPRTGTVQFMARTIRAGRLIGDDAMIPLFRRPPEIAESLLTRYGSTLPNRAKRFACPTPTHSPGPIENPSSAIPRHALRHAAEVSPPLPQGLWVTLTANHRDGRPTRIVPGERHPAYDAVRSVINALAAYLAPDLHWAADAPFTPPEFLHEAFQRLVLNFLGDHRDEGFMLLPTSGEPREFDSLVNYAEPPFSRREYLLRTSAKRPASSQGGLERKVENAAERLE